MKNYAVFIEATVAVKVSGIQADNPDEAARMAMAVMTPAQLDHIFARKIDERVETHFTDDIPAIMIDEVDAWGKPIDENASEWRRVDIPGDDINVFEAVENVLRTYGEGDGSPFASDDLKGKMELLQKAYAALPKTLARPVPPIVEPSP